MRTLIVGMSLALTMSACFAATPNKVATMPESMAEKSDQFQGSAAERDQMIASITQERIAIEARKDQLTRKEMSTEKLNERIKQKWSKLDFYSDNGKLLRIKSYPHPNISTRTEEFYFRDGQLMLAYVEDDGTRPEAGAVHTKGKEYYYSAGHFVAERNLSGEKEHGIRNSDEEGLEAEALEYQNIFKSLK
ncbi:MAG: hypothetical protein WBP11_00805 [Dokdonella sp.]